MEKPNKELKARSQFTAVMMRLRKNRLAMLGLAILLLIAIVAIFADVIADYDTKVIGQNMLERLQGPSAEHWFGTDQFGRDVFARIIHGARISLTLSIIAMVIAVAIGASRCCGSNDWHIIVKHIIPNAIGPIIVQATLAMGATILIIASLSFMGLGVKPPASEWGTMLYEGRDFLRQAPYLVLFPGGAITLSVISLNLLGDGLRDALDPRLKN